MRKLIPAALALATLAGASPAGAVTLEFFEGNNCTQDKLGGVNTVEHVRASTNAIPILSPTVFRAIGIPISNSDPWNDEARSVLITSNWKKQREPKSGKIYLYDKAGRDGRSDDWVVIVIEDATRIPDAGLCIGSFERSFNRAGIFLERHPQNGIDGKISYIESRCNQACRRDLTPDPHAPSGPIFVAEPRGNIDRCAILERRSKKPVIVPERSMSKISDKAGSISKSKPK